MASTTIIQTKPRQRKGNKGGGGKGATQPRNTHPSNQQENPPPAATKKENPIVQASSHEEDANICWICAEPVKYFSISECNHRTCHVCALRLRALYKKLDCAFCKEPQSSVIFTVSPDAVFSSFTAESIPYKDSKLSIFFETQEMMENTLILLRFNCPNSECDYIGSGWSDLKLHVRGTHGKLMCDLCLQMKKVFAHEHVLYPPNILPLHLPSIPSRSAKTLPPEKIEGGVHPLCEFCRECFVGGDELYAHMRERHEECFICKRNEVLHQYFRDYNAMEQHFMHAHHPCKHPTCLARKFVVFGTAMDLKAHLVEEHGAEMSSRDKKDARRVEVNFEFEEIPGGRRRRERGNNRDRDREPPPPPPQPPGLPRQPLNIRRREFGANLTADGVSIEDPSPSTVNRVVSPSPDVDPVVAERHAAFLSRLRNFAPNPQGAVNSVKLAVRSYRASESAAKDLISTIWNVLDQNLDGTASIVNATVDILDDEEKKNDLLSAWNSFKVEQRNQFPELVPVGIGSNYAGIASGRVLNAKHSTVTRSSQSSRQLLDRVAQAAASSSRLPLKPPERFPLLQPLVASSSSSVKQSNFRQAQHTTPWSASATAASSSSTPVSLPPAGSNSNGKTESPILSKGAFPQLPQSSVARAPKNSVNGNQSLRNILGESVPANSAWGGAPGQGALAMHATEGAEEPVRAGPTGKGKKGKGKQKQTLFTLGTFPT